jgi:hypothetical protein
MMKKRRIREVGVVHTSEIMEKGRLPNLKMRRILLDEDLM